MSIRARLTGHLLGRAFVLLLTLGLVFSAWMVGVAVYITAVNRPPNVAGTSPMRVLETVRDATTVDGTEVSVDPAARERVAELDGWIQVLDPQGSVVYSYRAPASAPASYAPGQLVYFRSRPSEIGQGSLYTLYDTEKGRLTWVLGSERAWQTPLQRSVQPLTLVQALLGLLVVSIGVSLLLAWVGAERLSRPLVHVMSWIDGLAHGDYGEPVDGRGLPASRMPDGGLRAQYRTYEEVIGSIETLAGELGRNEAERTRIEAAREEWISGITHDLRTPLSSVRGYAELLGSEYEFSAEETRQYGRTIRSQAENMERLIDDLGLTFRLRADALPLERDRADLGEIAREAAVAIANDPRAAEHSIEFEDGTEGATLPVLADARYVARALGNLLGNAVVHNPAGTTVTARTSREGGWARVDITDDGRGMDAETLGRLFDRYYRGTAADGDTYGTGLGMAIARQLIEAHGGTIEVESEIGRGTSVTVRLPLAG